MAIVQGVENIDVPIPMKSMEAQLVGDAESRIVAQLNAQGKRVVRIDHSTRPGGFGEFSGTHATVTVLWEADTENPTYKALIDKQKAEEERIRQAQLEKERAAREAAEKARIEAEKRKREQTEKNTSSFWKRNESVKKDLLDERDWLRQYDSDWADKPAINSRIAVINNILNKKREDYDVDDFSPYEKVKILERNLFKIRLTDKVTYNQLIEREPILKDLDTLTEKKSEKADEGDHKLTILGLVCLLMGIGLNAMLAEDYNYDGFAWLMTWASRIFLIGLGGLCFICGIVLMVSKKKNHLDIKSGMKPYFKALNNVQKEIDKLQENN